MELQMILSGSISPRMLMEIVVMLSIIFNLIHYLSTLLTEITISAGQIIPFQTQLNHHV